MPLSYDGGLLGHLAEHMLYLSTTPSFWYSLNSSYDHGFHLSHRLGMTPHDYERLLAAANLAHYHRNGGSAVAAARRLWRWHQRDRAMSAAAWLQQRGCFGGGGSATTRRHNLHSGK